MAVMSSAEPAGTAELVGEFESLYRGYYHEDILELADRYPNEQTSLEVDWYDLFRFNAEIAEKYLDHPDKYIDFAEAALKEYDIPVDIGFDDANVRLVNLPDGRIYDVGTYRSEHVNTLIGVRGVVSKQSQVQPRPTMLAFECQRDGTITKMSQAGGYQEPYECEACERQGPFAINHEQSEFVDHRMVRLQVPPDRTQGKANDATIDVHLERDLVNSIEAGDRVTIYSRLRAEQQENNKSVFKTFAEAESVDILETDFEDVDIESDDEQLIQKIASGDDPYSTLIRSFCPNVYGHDHVKEAIILQLFGGMTKPLPGGSQERGHSHVALIGDPGTSKSTMLKYASQIAPRSIYTSGKGSSAAGLTAAAVRDDFGPGNEWTLEGGAIVKADKGIAAIDELDKMDDHDRSSLHEAMEQMTVSVSKAGINATLNARTTILAAANPTHGRFDQYASIPDQIDLEPALLSRFDLIFTFTDSPDKELDRAIIGHKSKAWDVGARMAADEFGVVEDGDIKPDLEQSFVRKYIAYAKTHCHPTPTERARELVESEMLALRMSNKDANGEDKPVPVTFRKQEAIHRLAESSARVRLSDTVEEQDVKRALRLVMRSLEDVGMDPETNELDADVLEVGHSTSQRKRRRQLKGVIQELAKKDDERGAPLDEVHRVMVNEGGYTQSKVDHDIQHFKDKGKVYSPDDDRIEWWD